MGVRDVYHSPLMTPRRLAAVPWHRSRAADERLLRVVWTSLGQPLARVTVDESADDEVVVTLFEWREPEPRADGAPVGYALVARTRCVAVELGKPVAQRRRIDGSTGQAPDLRTAAAGYDPYVADAMRVDLERMPCRAVPTGELLEPEAERLADHGIERGESSRADSSRKAFDIRFFDPS
jgi:hypothetical protein